MSVVIIMPFAAATPSAVASFSDARCTAGGVCPNDPLIFTCEVNDAITLRVALPTGEQEVVSIGDIPSDLHLPAGFTVDTLFIAEMDILKRNFSLTLSIENASLLNGGQITCDDITTRSTAMAGCPLAGEPSVQNFTMKEGYKDAGLDK